MLIHLELLQLTDVAFTPTNHFSHLVLMFLLLMQSLRLLPPLFLLRKLERDRQVLTWRKHFQVVNLSNMVALG